MPAAVDIAASKLTELKIDAVPGDCMICQFRPCPFGASTRGQFGDGYNCHNVTYAMGAGRSNIPDSYALVSINDSPEDIKLKHKEFSEYMDMVWRTGIISAHS